MNQRKMTAEDWVIASVIKRPGLIVEINEVLRPFHFLDPQREGLYKGILEHVGTRVKRDKNFEPMTNAAGDLMKETVIGPSYIQILESKPQMAEYVSFITSQPELTQTELKKAVKTITENYRREMTKRAYQKGIDDINAGKPLPEVDASTNDLLTIAELAGNENPIIDQKQATLEYIDEHEEARKRGKVTKLSSGFQTLDYLLAGGFRPGDFIVLASGTGQGKSTLAGQFMVSFANQDARVGMIGLEMDHKEYVKRQVSLTSHIHGLTGLPGWILDNPHKTFNEADFLGTLERVSQYPFYYLKSKLINVAEMKKYFKILLDKYKCNVIMLDHTLLVASDEEERHKIASICNFMKSFAAENNIVCLAVSQMNRGSDNKNYKVDNLSGGRAIEHAATQLLTIGEFESDNVWDETEGFKKITLLKSRHSKSGTFFKVDFYDQYARFIEILPDNWDTIKEKDKFGLSLTY